MMGLVGEWTLPRKVEPLYMKQVTAERREGKGGMPKAAFPISGNKSAATIICGIVS